MHDKILILDFGSQVTQLIARRVREARRMAAIAGVGATAGGVSNSLMASSIWQNTQHTFVDGNRLNI
jgi:hypothetical protein